MKHNQQEAFIIILTNFDLKAYFLFFSPIQLFNLSILQMNTFL